MQDEFIHQIIFDEGMHQHTAAIRKNIFTGLVLEFANFFDDIAADDGGIAPSRRRFQRSGNNIFFDIAKWILFGRQGFKRIAVGFPGFAPEQKGIGGFHGLREAHADVVVPKGNGPAAVREAAIGIFIHAAGA